MGPAVHSVHFTAGHYFQGAMRNMPSPFLGTALDHIYDVVLRRSPAEPEFHQAVREVLETIGPVVAEHPEYMRQKLLERICEPERQIIFRVSWTDDRGEVHINRGYRVEYN